MIILPRQARDQHRESTQKVCLFSQAAALKQRPKRKGKPTPEQLEADAATVRGFREQRKLFLAGLSDAKRAWLDAQHEGGGGRQQQQQQQKQRDRGPSEAAQRLALREFAIRAAPAASRTEQQSDQTSDTDQTVQQQQEEVLGLVDIGANLHGRYRYVETQRVTSSLLTGGCVFWYIQGTVVGKENTRATARFT
jgi:hypothetical protein